MAARKVYSRARAARWPAPEGSQVTVEASVDGDVVSITWERDDLKAAGAIPTHIALRREEFDAIVAAVRGER